MADYWIKLYHEIIDDPKMATLPDRLWRRTIELFLLAGRLCPDKSGKLPDTRQLAWLLRISTDDLQTDLDQLTTTGIVEPVTGGWVVVNFQKRQQAASSSERVKQFRKRQQREQYEDVTTLKRNVTQINRDRLTEREEEPPYPLSPEIEVYREVTGLVPDIVKEPDVIRNIQEIRNRLKQPPRHVLLETMREKYTAWCETKSSDGRPYNPSNPGWLEWCITGYMPQPGTNHTNRLLPDGV